MRLRSVILLFIGLLLVSLLQPILICASTSQSFTKGIDYTILIKDKYDNILGLLHCHIKIEVSYGNWLSYYVYIVFHFESSGNAVYQPPLIRLSLINESMTMDIRDGSTWFGKGTWILRTSLNFEPGESKRECYYHSNMSISEDGPVEVVNPVLHLKEEFDIRIESSDGQEWNAQNFVLFEISITKENETYLVPQTYSIYAFNKVDPPKRLPSFEYTKLASQYEDLQQRNLQLEEQYATLSGSYDDSLMELSSLENQLSALQNEVSLLSSLILCSIIVIVILSLAFAINIKKHRA